MSDLNDNFQTSENLFLAVSLDGRPPKTDVKTSKTVSSNKSTSSYATRGTRRINNLDTISEAETFGNYSELTEDQRIAPDVVHEQEPIDEEEARSSIEQTLNDDEQMETIQNLVEKNSIATPELGNVCSRAMFSHKKGTIPCDKPNCKYIHQEAKYVNLIKSLMKVYNIK
jgi:DNA-binding protein H-NS